MIFPGQGSQSVGMMKGYGELPRSSLPTDLPKN
jgi:malonyl CoA-acyl carrier protein transacylase